MSPALDPAALGALWLSLQAQPLGTAALLAQPVRASQRMLRERSGKALQRCLARGCALADWNTKAVLRCAQKPTLRLRAACGASQPGGSSHNTALLRAASLGVQRGISLRENCTWPIA